MARWQRIGWMLACTVALATGCGPNAAKESAPEGQATRTDAAGGFADADNRAAEAPAAASRREQAPGKPAPAEEAKKDAPAGEGRYIIRRGSVVLQVKDVRQAMAEVQRLARAQSGFVSDSNLEASEGARPSATMTLRVPAARFDQVLDSLGGVGTVRAKQVSGEDVTLEFVDTGARVRNLQREEAELLRLLDRAGKLSEVLEVERELSRVRGQIEQAQGRLRQLSSLVDLATIEVSLSENVQVVSTSPWQLGPVFENAWANAQRELAGTVAALVAGAVWLLAFVLPIAVPALLLFWLVGWALRRWLVDRKQLVTGVIYDRVWAASALALLALAFPPLIGVVALVAVIAALVWAGGGAFRSLRKKTAYKD
jgi:hypothetical protein